VANGGTDLLVRALGERTAGRPGLPSGWLHCRSGSPWRSSPSSRWPTETPGWTVDMYQASMTIGGLTPAGCRSTTTPTATRPRLGVAPRRLSERSVVGLVSVCGLTRFGARLAWATRGSGTGRIGKRG
jgi:hypothetical protein